jgi:hypothetical protein
MTTRALVKEADMKRAIRAAKKLGAARVSIAKDGTIVFDIQSQQGHLHPQGASDETGPIKIRKHAKKRMDF